jgi:hypothetical protein
VARISGTVRCETWSLTLREEHRQAVLEQDAEENIWTEER